MLFIFPFETQSVSKTIISYIFISPFFLPLVVFSSFQASQNINIYVQETVQSITMSLKQAQHSSEYDCGLVPCSTLFLKGQTSTMSLYGVEGR